MTMRDFEGGVYSGRDLNEALVAFVMPQVFEHHFFG